MAQTKTTTIEWFSSGEEKMTTTEALQSVKGALTLKRLKLEAEIQQIDTALEVIAKQLETNGGPKPTVFEYSRVPKRGSTVNAGKAADQSAAAQPTYLKDVREAASNNQAALIVLRNLPAVEASDLRREFELAGRKVAPKTLRAILTHLKQAERIGRGTYRLKRAAKAAMGKYAEKSRKFVFASAANG
jgi:hypothetical protein